MKPEQPSRHTQKSSQEQEDAHLSLDDLVMLIIVQCHESLASEDFGKLLAVQRRIEGFQRRVEAECHVSHSLRLIALQMSSRISFEMDDHQKAEDDLNKAIQLAAVHSSSSERDEYLSALRMSKAHLMVTLKRPGEALGILGLALENSEHLPARRVTIMLEMARIHMMAGRSHECESLIERASFEVPTDLDEDLRGELVDAYAHAGAREVCDGRFQAGADLMQVGLKYLLASSSDRGEKIEQLVAAIAQAYEKGGAFELASTRWKEALTRATERLGAEHDTTVDFRRSYASSLIEFDSRSFEQAETLLLYNYTIAEKQGDPEAIAVSAFVLSKMRQQRGIYGEAVKGLQELLDNYGTSMSPRSRIGVLNELSGLRAQCGQITEAVRALESALEEAEQLCTPEGVSLQVLVLGKLANLLSSEDPQRARCVLERCYALLDNIPHGSEPVSYDELRLVSLDIEGKDADIAEMTRVISARLEDFDGHDGHSQIETQAYFVTMKAKLCDRADKPDEAHELFEEARELLEQHCRTRTILYGQVLTNLLQRIPKDDPRAEEYRKTVEAIVSEMRNTRRELGEFD
jgi:tetratricopeptide (TPR) repeat protein